jgi:hypothetical protein
MEGHTDMEKGQFTRSRWVSGFTLIHSLSPFSLWIHFWALYWCGHGQWFSGHLKASSLRKPLMPWSHIDAKLGLGVCGNGWWVLSGYSFSPISPLLEGYGTRDWYEMVREVQIKSRIHFVTLLNIQLSLCGPLEHDNKMFEMSHRETQIQIEFPTSHCCIFRTHVVEQCYVSSWSLELVIKFYSLWKWRFSCSLNDHMGSSIMSIIEPKMVHNIRK